VRATDYTVLSTKPISRTRKVDAKFAKKETVSISRKVRLRRMGNVFTHSSEGNKITARNDLYHFYYHFLHVDEDKKLTIKTTNLVHNKPTVRNFKKFYWILLIDTCMAAELKITFVLRMNF
ncbi:hypothetical protein V1477_019447, partial [Vespula maculifrons]